MKMRAALLGLSLLSLLACGGGGGATSAPAPPPLTGNSVTSVTITPNPAVLSPGLTQQFAAAVQGTGTFTSAVTWSVNGVAGGNATVGTITTAGLYQTPYPIPASVTITATSTFDATKHGDATVNLTIPAATGPALTVDVATQTHSISPLIYGWNNYQSNVTAGQDAGVTVDRWGGNGTSRYNYKLDVGNIGADWYFETLPNSNTQYPDVSDFNTQVQNDKTTGAKTLGTVPVNGWTAKARVKACSFSVTKYGAQQKTDPYWADCGNGVKPDGVTNVTGNDPNETSMPITEQWTSDWVTYLVNKFGNAASGGVAIYSLDNEPSWWDANHRDVHPLPFTYDEVTINGLKVAKAVKAADPTAEVSGPVIDFWPNYFYSKKDVETGWGSGPNFVFNGNPVDRLAHGNVPLIEYYLQQFKAAQDADASHTRFLDYLDLHTYFVAKNQAFQTAGTTDVQMAVIDSTRVFWDSTYTDPNFTDPNDSGKNPQLMAPQIIRKMKSWIAADYPGTKTAITEYNWGAQEHISGAIAQADILGIFGREGLDVGTLWGPPDPNTQKPGLNAFKIFRNYDGAASKFGDVALSSTSADQSKLSVYGALRTSDNKVTVVVINKTYNDLTTSLSLPNLTATGPAKVYLYSNANLASIVSKPDQAVTTSSSGNSTMNNVAFPAMSVTVFAIPR